MNGKQLHFGGVFVVFFLIFVRSAQAQSTDLLVRALLPNPNGSDIAEWILLENTSQDVITHQTLSLQDTLGAVKTYVLPDDIQPGSFVFVSATESGIALNNQEDTVQLLRDGQVVDESFSYSDAQDDQVWWRSESGEWQWESTGQFLARLGGKDFLLSIAEETVASASSALLKEISLEEKISGEDILVTELNSTAIPEDLPPPTRYLGKNHLLTPTLQSTEMYKKPTLQDIHFPQFDFEAETALFVWWKKQALMGSLSLVFGGSCWVCLCFPYWWQKYRWRL